MTFRLLLSKLVVRVGILVRSLRKNRSTDRLMSLHPDSGEGRMLESWFAAMAAATAPLLHHLLDKEDAANHQGAYDSSEHETADESMVLPLAILVIVHEHRALMRLATGLELPEEARVGIHDSPGRRAVWARVLLHLLSDGRDLCEAAVREVGQVDDDALVGLHGLADGVGALGLHVGIAGGVERCNVVGDVLHDCPALGDQVRRVALHALDDLLEVIHVRHPEGAEPHEVMAANHLRVVGIGSGSRVRPRSWVRSRSRSRTRSRSRSGSRISTRGVVIVVVVIVLSQC
mmetsp:Transcript_11979/g.41320  ORF Transcript_11979/g.41320 Transcript_11979/m.41320 type:complete len:289 (-) Transcript_11979:84-950(-)